MATEADLTRALINADRAGDVEAAKLLAGEITRLRGMAQASEPAQAPPTLDQRAQDVFGFDPTLKRGSILPLARNQKGDMEFAAPQFVVDVAKSAILPGHVAQGGQYTEQDVTKAALDLNPMAHSPATPRAPTRRQFIRSAPSRDALRSQADDLYKAARAKGITVDGNSFFGDLAKMETKIAEYGPSKTLHPTATGVLNEWTKRVGNDLSLSDLEIMRREAATVAGKGGQEGAIGSIMVDTIDNFIDNLSPGNVLSGDPKDVADTLKRARSLWQRQAKVAAIDEIFEKAETQASGFENGLRIGFRDILRNPKKRRGFTRDELAAMKTVVNGGPVQSALRLLSKVGPPADGGNRGLGTAIGTSLGAAGGSAAGGPAGAMVGAVALPAVGFMSGRAAARNTATNAEMVRALAATGGKNPRLDTMSKLLMRKLPGPVAGTQIGPNGGLIVGGQEVF